MTRNQSFWRKVGYLCGIAVLFVPISIISAPAPSRDEGGGLLSRMRRDNKLSQAQLGKIDPASASMSLATLGMRGVAANLLWGRAHHYKKTENWDGFKATLNQITKLQPNFVSVWQFQAWNIAYNVSVEFDDFRHRYHWVKKGVDYLIEGTEYNEDEPLLLWDAGWFFGHKMGRADEYRQFRRLFRDDEDFHRELPIRRENVLGPDGRPDNWLVAREWFLAAQEAVDHRGARIRRLSPYYWMGDERVVDKKQTPLRGKNPLIFHSDPPKAAINYADAIEEDGYLDEIGQLAWENAGKEWDKYGDRDIISSYGIKIRLNDLERSDRIAAEAVEELDAIAPGVRERLAAEKRDALTDDERELVDTPITERRPEDIGLSYQIENRLKVSHEEVARNAPEEVREDAVRLALRALSNEEQARIIRRYREIVNFEYWRARCEAEQEDNTIAARKLVLEAEQAFDDTDLEGAKDLYEQAWDRWAVVFDDYPMLVDDVEGEDVMDSVRRYRNVLDQLDLPFPPEDFKLTALLEAYDDEPGLIPAELSQVDAPTEEDAAAGSDADNESTSDDVGTDEPGEPADEQPTATSDDQETDTTETGEDKG